jgi:hypothetical protein
MSKRNTERNESRGLLEGEGSYSATRRYNRKLADAVRDQDSMKRGAERARRAVEGPEGRELRAAEARARRGPKIRKRTRGARGVDARKRTHARRGSNVR